jgi:hypothetical protein
MANQLLPRSLRCIIGFAAITAAATVTLGWPQTTHADRDDLALWIAPGTKVGPTIVAEGRLVRDAKAKTGWAMEIKARNSGGKPATCDVVAMVSELEGIPVARVAPPPRIVWEERHSFGIAPHAEVVQRVPVPAHLAVKLDREAPEPAPPPVAKQTQARTVPPAKAQAPTRNRIPSALAELGGFSSLSVRLQAAG